jgi:retinol dehydrogenase-12
MQQKLAGRVALVTGGNSGIGLVTARELARQGAHVFIACRSAERADAAIAQIRQALATDAAQIEALSLDLADFESVRRCAQGFLERSLPLHLLINNGGVAGSHGMTASGFELAFGVNHMGHFLLTRLLLERLLSSAPGRVISVASRQHVRLRKFDWEAVRTPTRTFTGMREYGVAKLANILFSSELGRRLRGSGVTSYALHPGVVASEVWRSVPWPIRTLWKLSMLSTDEGARTTLHCATAPELAGETSLYYDECRSVQPSLLARDVGLAAELWARSEDWIAPWAEQPASAAVRVRTSRANRA